MAKTVTTEEKNHSLAKKFTEMLEQIPEDMQEKALCHIEGMVFYARAQKTDEKALAASNA